MSIMTPRDTLGIYYDAIIPPGESGYLHLALGLNGYFAADGQYTFLYVAAPLKVMKGTGSPVNPVAIK